MGTEHHIDLRIRLVGHRQFSYVIESSGEVLDPLDEDGVQGGQEDFVAPAPKDLISIATLHPNPTSGQTLLVLDAKADVKARVVLMDMSGNLIVNIFQGMLFEAWETSVNVNMGVESGMYGFKSPPRIS